MSAMTPEAKAKLSKTIRGLRERLLADLEDALRGDYSLGIPAEQAKLSAARAEKRKRLDAWVDEQVRALPDKERKTKKQQDAALARFRGELVKQAAYTWLNRLVYLRLLEGMKLQPAKLLTGGLASGVYGDFRDLAQALVGHDDGDDSDGYAFLLGLVFDELALDLPGLFGRSGLGELVPMRWSTLRQVIEALDSPDLVSCWTDDMTLGWVYQYWNDPEREALDEKVAEGGKIAPHELASKTQMFTERYMVDWLLQNSLGRMWLAMCKKHGWTALAESDGTFARLAARQAEWRGKRDAGEIDATELMPLQSESEQRWVYHVHQVIPDDAVASAPDSIRKLKLLDPAVGSGHFLVEAFDLLTALYREEAHHRGETGQPQWSDDSIAESILANNLFGIDIDPRAVQIAAAALLLKAKRVSPGVRPIRLNLVASELRLSNLPDNDPALIELRAQVERETGIPERVTNALVHELAGADHLGSLLKVGQALEEALKSDVENLTRVSTEQGLLFLGGFTPVSKREPISLDEAKVSLLRRLEGFLAAHTSSADLGLRLRGEQLAAGVRFARMTKDRTYDIVAGNPPYQGTGKLQESGYVAKHYPDGKTDLLAAFFLRGLEMVRPCGLCALITLSNWMFLRTFSPLRRALLGRRLIAIADLGKAAFSTGGTLISTACTVVAQANSSRVSVAVRPHSAEEIIRDHRQPLRTNSALMMQRGRHEFDPIALQVVPEWPLVYWWDEELLRVYQSAPLIGEVAPAKMGANVGDNTRFHRRVFELAQGRVQVGLSGDWAYLVRGAAGKSWVEPADVAVFWRWSATAIKWRVIQKFGDAGLHWKISNSQYYFTRGVAFSMIGANFSARVHRYPSVFGNKGSSIFPADLAGAVCAMNSTRARQILESLNPGIGFEVGDVNRLPLFPIADANAIFAQVEAAFGVHESHREPSIEFKRPGPSPWRQVQDWAQLAVDRPENTPLPRYDEILDPEPPTDHISFALGAALGRFDPAGKLGILDPQTTDLAHALPHGVLFLDGTLTPDATTDGLGHPAAALLQTAWSEHAAAIDSKRKHLRDYLRHDFFADVHRSMYENRPIHWPLSSSKKTFVAWINIHRWHAGTLRYLLAEHLQPTKQRLDGEVTDLRKVRDGADTKAARAAEKRFSCRSSGCRMGGRGRGPDAIHRSTGGPCQ